MFVEEKILKPTQQDQTGYCPSHFGSGKVLEWEEIRDRLQSPLVFPRPIQLHLIRHAQTETNAEKLITGSRDVQLTSNGEAQALALGEQLSDAYDMAVCSTLQRSKKTLELALVSGKIRVDKRYKDARLNERSLGILEGQKFHLIPEYESGDLNYAPQQGESYNQVARRILSFLLELGNWVVDKDLTKVLLCGHMGPMRIMVGIVEEKDDPKTVLGFSFANAEVFALTWKGLKIPGFLQNIQEKSLHL